MKMIKKAIAFLLVFSLPVALLTGCQKTLEKTSSDNKASKVSDASAPAVSSTEPVTITIWDNAEAPISGALQAELDKLAPDIIVKLERKENLADALKLAGNDPNSAPDMYFYAHDKIGVFAQIGILSPITNFISKEDMNDLLPMAIDAATYKNEIYQLPVYFETLMFMYNKDLMKEPPKTTDDLLSYMKDNTANGMYGFVEEYCNAYYVAPWMHAYGAGVINENAEPGLSAQQMMDALAYHKQFVPYFPADSDYNTITTLFKEGKAHAIISGPWLVGDIKAAGIDLGFAQMPTVNATGKPLSPYSGIQGICVLKVAENKKDAVTAVLKQLLKEDIGISLAKTASCAPVNLKCYDNADVSGNEMIQTMKDTAEAVVPMVNVPEMDVMWSVMENLLITINKKDGDVKAECDKAQQDALSKIEAMK